MLLAGSQAFVKVWLLHVENVKKNNGGKSPKNLSDVL